MRWLVLPLAALAVTVSAAAHGNRAAACTPNLANRLETRRATQLVTAVARTRPSTQGTLRLWQKRGGCWRTAAGPWTAWLGQRGTSPAKREGDRRTPSGIFSFGRVMYGLAPNPGVRYSYRRIVCGDWWVEDPASPYYNRFRHVRCGAKPPFRVKSEDMSRSPTAYRHLAVLLTTRARSFPAAARGSSCMRAPGGRRSAASASRFRTSSRRFAGCARGAPADRDRHDRRPPARCGFPVGRIRVAPVAIAVARGDDRGMTATYGVVWREGNGALARGRLELLPGALRLDGIAGSTPVLRELPYDELEGVRVGRTGSDRLNGHPSLVLKPRSAEPFVIAAVAQAGVVAELTERLTRLALG